MRRLRAQMQEPASEEVRPWSRRLIAFMLLVVGLAALLAGSGGAFLGVWLVSVTQVYSGLNSSPAAPFLYLGAGLACLLVGPLFWWLVILRPRRLSPGLGALVGVLGSLVAHPLMWVFVLGVPFLFGSRSFCSCGQALFRASQPSSGTRCSPVI